MQCSKIFDAMGFKVIPRKSSAQILILCPLNFGLGVTRPAPKSVGTSLSDRNILKIDFKMVMTEGWANLKCSIHRLSGLAAVLFAIFLMASSTMTVVIKTFGKNIESF